MTWTATLLHADDRESHWKIGVEFSDDTGRTKQVAYRFTGSTPAELARFVRQRALEFERSDGVDLTPFIGQSIDVTPPVVTPPDPPTQAELDRAAWFNDYNRLRAMLQVTGDIPALLTPQATTAISNLRASLETGWNNSYLDGVG